MSNNYGSITFFDKNELIAILFESNQKSNYLWYNKKNDMKKTFLLLMLFYMHTILGQTKLVAVDLVLKKSSEYHQVLPIVNSLTKEVYVLASDKEKTTLVKFNSALFFADSLQTKKIKNYPSAVANSFSEDGNPIYYWASEDFKQFMAITYNFKQRTTNAEFFDIPFTNETILTSFSKNNRFYILSVLDLSKQVKLYVFDGNSFMEKTLDFEVFNPKELIETPFSITNYLKTNPLEVIDNDVFNPLLIGCYKIKIYPLNDKLLFTFDFNFSQTQILEIDWKTFEIVEKKFPQANLKTGVGKSNSFYHHGNLYQFKANETQLIISKHDYNGKEPSLEYSVMQNEVVAFKNSPFYIQSGNYQPQEIKNTKKILNRLKNKSLGLTIYKTQNDLLFTIGGTNNVLNSGSIVIGSLVTIGGIIAGGEVYSPDLFANEMTQNVFFECRFDSDFKPNPSPFEPLAEDFISGFLRENNSIITYNTIKYNDYYILSYYDSKEKHLILRKFEDGYPF